MGEEEVWKEGTDSGTVRHMTRSTARTSARFAVAALLVSAAFGAELPAATDSSKTPGWCFLL